VLIVGVSTRAAAESAAKAGFDVIALDGYADLDQHPSVRALSLSRDFGMAFSAETIVSASKEISSDAVVYLSNLENHPGAVDALASERALWGNPPAVLRRVRDPNALAAAFAERGACFPRVLTSSSHTPIDTTTRWLIKPRVSGGGHGVRFWSAGEAVSRGHYLQEFMRGVPGSVVFVAAGGGGVALGISRQLVGESAFGVSGFRYCGNIISVREDLIAPATALVQALTEAFPLVGVGSIDFISTDGRLCPVEVNPRWTASMELVERARNLSMFGTHADACMRAALPSFDLTRWPAAAQVHGKAIVFAREDIAVGDTQGWLADPSVRDVPRAGEHIAAGQPICTVFAVAPDDAGCHQRLVERAERIYADVARSG
jgi:predicted ATP-grasp superfamily ATP-dependent carboligase